MQTSYGPPGGAPPPGGQCTSTCYHLPVRWGNPDLTYTEPVQWETEGVYCGRGPPVPFGSRDKGVATEVDMGYYRPIQYTVFAWKECSPDETTDGESE